MRIECCSECFDRLARANTSAAKLWVELCMQCTGAGGYIFIQEHLSPALTPLFRSLEMMRFISSCDLQNCIAIRVEGHLLLEEDGVLVDGYCIDQKHIEREFSNGA